MADRIHDILSYKASLGMGYDSDSDDEFGYGYCGGAKVKNKRRVDGAKGSPWVDFLKQYSAANGMTYGEAMIDTDARKAYCSAMRLSRPLTYKNNAACNKRSKAYKTQQARLARAMSLPARPRKKAVRATKP